MLQNKWRRYFLMGGLIITVAGCARPALRTIQIFNETLSFVPDPKDDNVMIYRSPRLKATSYSMFLIEPADIFTEQSTGNRGIKPAEKTILANGFRDELVKALKDGYKIVDEPGPGVLRVRTAIRDIHPAHWQLDEDKFLILKFDTTLESAAMELDCLDSVSGKQVVALVHTLNGPRYMEPENAKRLGNIRDAFSAWAKSLRTRFDEAREQNGTKP